MDNQDLAPHSKESQGSYSHKRVKIGTDLTQASNLKEQAEAKSTTKRSEIQCHKCKEYGHKCSACPNGRSEDKEKHTPARRTRPRIKDKFEERKAI